MYYFNKIPLFLSHTSFLIWIYLQKSSRTDGHLHYYDGLFTHSQKIGTVFTSFLLLLSFSFFFLSRESWSDWLAGWLQVVINKLAISNWRCCKLHFATTFPPLLLTSGLSRNQIWPRKVCTLRYRALHLFLNLRSLFLADGWATTKATTKTTAMTTTTKKGQS